jgi:hypothetical protein
MTLQLIYRMISGMCTCLEGSIHAVFTYVLSCELFCRGDPYVMGQRLNGGRAGWIQRIQRNQYTFKNTEEAGFIIRKEQRYLIVDSCISTGKIRASSGDICGYRSGYNSSERRF